MESSMFLNQPTVIDHAYIDHEGRVIGGSFNPCFIVTGKVDPVEHVVVDFSNVKKTLKALIDDRETGFDHKLWVLTQVSNAEVSVGETSVSITTPCTTMELPRNAVKFLHTALDYTKEEVGKEFESYLNTEMRAAYPGVGISVEVHNAARHQLMTLSDPLMENLDWAIQSFSYVHGLKDSTSWGCQNIGHGHASFVQIFFLDELPAPPGKETSEDPYALLTSIGDYLDRTIFVNHSNVVSFGDPEEWWINLEYSTPERGTFRAGYNTRLQKVCVLESETTVEHLVDHVVSLFGDRLRKSGVSKLFLSEGLSKGAMVNL